MNQSITKIWTTIIVLACTYGALIYWGAKSYKDSSASIESILLPDLESKAINSLYKFIVQSDLHFNNFILTNDSTQWRYSLTYGQKVDSLLVEIEYLAGKDNRQKATSFDSLKAIIKEKSRINSILIDLKKKQNSYFFTEQALERIKIQLSDSAYIDKSIVFKSDLITTRDTLEHLDIVQSPDEYRGLRGFFRKIFGKEKIQIDTIVTLQEQINYGLEVSIDSSIVRDYYIDTTVALVKKILIDVLDEEVQLQKELHTTELELITYNELLLRNIRNLLDDISFSNEHTLRAEQELAKRKIEKANSQFLIIAGSGLFLGFVLLIILIKDITRTNLYRKQLEKEKERAEQLAAAKEIFLSKMSHEIRTPLHSISGFTHLLDKEIGRGKQRKFLTGISHANHYLNELISNILEQARISSGTFKLEATQVYIPDLCKEIEILFKLRKEEQENTFKLSYSDELKNYTVVIDPVKLKQVLINLLGNAFKYTAKGSVLLDFSLLSTGRKNKLKVLIADTGTGIDPKDQPSIFEPFNQIPNSQPNNMHGTGLGLSISKHIVEHFGGDIQLQSEAGKGSVFTIHIPVTCEPFAKKPEKTVVPDFQNAYYPINVLAIEDDKWNAYLLENYLSGHLQKLKLCETAEQALAELGQTPNHYDIILTDMNLPQMDGKTFFQKIAGNNPPPVIALSASLSKKDYDLLIQLGFANALGKPFNQKDLLDAIDKLFKRKPLPEKAGPQPENFKIDMGGLVGFMDAGSLQADAYYAQFISSFESKVNAFKQAINVDLKELGRMAHQLKSNCEQIGITDLSERLHSIELFAEIEKKDRAFEEAGSILPLLESILSELQQGIRSE